MVMFGKIVSPPQTKADIFFIQVSTQNLVKMVIDANTPRYEIFGVMLDSHCPSVDISCEQFFLATINLHKTDRFRT